MNATRLLQIPVLLTLLFASVGTNRSVSASTDPQPREVLQTQTSVSITIVPALLAPNETATATVSLNNVPAEGYTSAEFTCTYRTDLVQISDIVLTGLFGPDPATAVYGPQDGTFIVGVAGSQDNKATAGGPVFTFHIKALATGQAAVDCTARVSDGSNVLTGIGSASASLMIMEATATPTIVPTACDKAELVADVSVPPGTTMMPGAQFTKTWRFQNVGSCTWTTSYRVAFLSGEQMGAPSSARFAQSVAPGQTVDISLDMTAPITAGSYYGYWIFQNDTGKPFGIGFLGNQPWLVSIVVSNATLTPTPTLTPSLTSTPTPFLTPTFTQTPMPTPAGPTPTPLAGTLYDFALNICAATWSSGAGQLPCPGTEGDPRGFAVRRENPQLETGAIYTQPSILAFPQNVTYGYIQGLFPPIRVQSGDRFRSILTCESGATGCYVSFRLGYQIGNNPMAHLWGFLERYDGQYYSMDWDLSQLAGQDVRFALIVDAMGPATDDRALWAGPILYRPLATPTPFVPSITPTPLESATSTPLPSLGTLTGQVYAGKPVTLSLYRENATFVTSTTANADGTFSFTLPAGTYLLIARADGFLGAQGSVTVAAGTASAMPVISLPPGDIDGNDMIEQFDVLTIGMNYNTSFPPAADLNNDGIINVLDLELLAKNYRKTGPVPWQ